MNFLINMVQPLFLNSQSAPRVLCTNLVSFNTFDFWKDLHSLVCSLLGRWNCGYALEGDSVENCSGWEVTCMPQQRYLSNLCLRLVNAAVYRQIALSGYNGFDQGGISEILNSVVWLNVWRSTSLLRDLLITTTWIPATATTRPNNYRSNDPHRNWISGLTWNTIVLCQWPETITKDVPRSYLLNGRQSIESR